MSVVVTGALGAIGSQLVPELRKRGIPVTMVDLSHHHDPGYVRADVREYRQLERVFNSGIPYEYVFHLAAEFGRWNGEDYYENLWRTNVIGVKNILQLQKQYGFRLIFFSSSEVYGDWEGVMSEDVMDTEEIKQLNDYAMTKWVSEMQCLNAEAMYGTQIVRFRLFNIYGPGEYYTPYRSVNARFIYSALHKLPYTVYRGHHRTSTYVTDAVRTITNVMFNFKPGEVYNIGGGQYHDIETLSSLVLEHTNGDKKLVTYKDSEPFTTKNKMVDTTKAQRDLGHRCDVSLSEGIRRTVEWMRGVYDV
jgi:dTDP-glucose 4,6-dehydratase